jgi:hypothetical protein
MKNLYIKGADFVPEVDLNSETGELSFSGKSYHEDTFDFYQPILHWLDKYLEEPYKSVTLNFKMTYYNTSSARIFIEILMKLLNYQNDKGGDVVVNWYYPEKDLDLLESGEEYAEGISELVFNIIPY